MLIKKLLKYKYIILFLLLLAGGITFYLLSLPPASEKDDLQVMRLKSDASPTFRLEAQLGYTEDLIAQLQQNLSGGSKEPSPTHTLNISIPLSTFVGKAEFSNEFSPIVKNLDLLAAYVPHLTISLFPDENITDQAYIELCDEFTSLLSTTGKSNIEVIWFPQDFAVFKQYEKLDSITSIGASINSMDDLEILENFYTYFKDSKKIYVRENVIGTSGEGIRKTTKEINAIYYMLAISYPECQTIFSPLVKGPFGLQDSFTLSTSNPDYATYQSIYGRLFDEPWLTLKETPLATTSPYENLNSYDVLRGTEEILLSPESTILPNSPGKVKTASNSSYIHYRFEDQEISVQSYYPYVAHVDTTIQPNGLTRLKALGYDNTGNVVEVQNIDLTVQNETTLTRAKRTLVDFPLNEQVQYQTDYIPILMYHTVTDVVAEAENNSCVETSLFDAQMKALVDNGYTPINFKTLHDYLNGVSGLPAKPILITMDDGYLNNYTHAYPIYKKYNIPATLFVSPYFMKEENTQRHFGWKAAKEMEDSGLIDIQSHGYNHTPLPYLSLKDVRYQISRSKGLIEQNLGPRDVFVVAYPQFRNTKYTRNLLSELGTDFQITKLAKRGTGLNPSSLKRINVPNTMSPDALIHTIEDLTN